MAGSEPGILGIAQNVADSGGKPTPEDLTPPAEPKPITADRTTAQNASGLIAHVPDLLHMPEATLAIAKNANNIPDPVGLAQACVFTQHAQDLAAQAKTEAPGFWGELRHGLASTYDQFNQWANTGVGEVTTEAKDVLSGNDVYDQAASPVVDQGIIDFYNHLPEPIQKMISTDTGQTLEAIGWTASQAAHVLNIGQFAGNTATVFTGNPNVGRDVTSGINTAFNFWNQLYRTYTAVKIHHGTGAALAAIAPGLAAAGLAAAMTAGSGGAGTEAGAGELAVEESAMAAENTTAEAAASTAGETTAGATTVPDAEAMARAGITPSPLSPDAVQRLWTPEEVDAQIASKEAVAASKHGLLMQALDSGTTASRMVGNIANAAESITRNSIGLPIRAIGAVGKFAASPEMLAFESEQWGQNALFNSKLWNEAANGPAWEKKYGVPATIGNAVAQAIGADGTGGAIIANALNFGTQFLMVDPLGAAGHSFAEIRSAEGMGGRLGQFFGGGAAFDNAENLYNAKVDASGFRRAIRFISSSSAADIMRWRPNLSEVAGQLDDLKVYNEPDVVRHNVEVINPDGTSTTVTRVLTKDGHDATVNVEATAPKIVKFFTDKASAQQLTRMDVLPIRSSGDFFREVTRDSALGKKFTLLPMFQQGDKIVNGEFPVGDKAAIPAIGVSLRQAGATKGAVDDVMNVLAHTDDPVIWRQTITNIWHGVYDLRLRRSLIESANELSPEDKQEIADSMHKAIDEHISEFLGTAHAAKEGIFGIGPDGTPLSKTDFLEHDGTLRGDQRASALYPSQLSKMQLPKYHQVTTDINGMVVKIRTGVEQTTMIRGLRFTRLDGAWVRLQGDYLRDTVNHYVNDMWFKPLALATPSWAERVITSEGLLTLYRQGGIKTVASHFARGATYSEERLLGYAQRVAAGTAEESEIRALMEDTATHAAVYFRKSDIPMPPPKEFTAFVSALQALRLGFDRGIVRSMGQDYLLEAAAASLYLNDGHMIPLSMASNHSGSVIEIDERQDAVGKLREWGKQNGMAKNDREQAVLDGNRYSRRLETPRNVRVTKKYQQSSDAMDVGEKIALRHNYAKFLQNDPWGRELVTTYHDTYIRTGSSSSALVATRERALQLIDEMGPKYKDFDRSRMVGVETPGGSFHSTGIPKVDHAESLALNTENFLLGPSIESRVSGNAARMLDQNRRYYDAKTAESIKDGAVPESSRAFRKMAHDGIPDSYFGTVIGPVYDPVRGALSVRAVGDFVQNKFLGKLVNRFSRDPTYIVDFARERKLLAPMVYTERPLAARFGMTPQDLEATGETLYHGTVRQFERFDTGSAVDRYGKTGRTGHFYFTPNARAAEQFGGARAIATLDFEGLQRVWPDMPSIEEYHADPSAVDAEMLSVFRDQGIKEGELRKLNDAGEWVPAKWSDVDFLAVQDGEIGRAVNPNARTLETKVYGKTIDLDPTLTGAWFRSEYADGARTWFDSQPKFVQDWLTTKFHSEDPAKIARDLRDYSVNWRHEHDPAMRDLLAQAREQGYGKIRVADSHESGGESVIAHPDMIGYNRDVVGEYAAARQEALRPTGTMTQAEADVLAQTRAVAKMIRFIHNPLDKTVWDEMMRVVAPFYFAQMQAWRRVGRLATENPGAFEQYVKLMLGTTGGIAKVGGVNGGFFTLPFPGIFGLRFQASFNVSQSMDPFASTETATPGSLDPISILRESMLPAAGPVAAVPIKVWQDVAMTLPAAQPDWANKVGAVVMGNWQSTPLWMDVLPNSVLQHLVEGEAGFLGWPFGHDNNSITSSYMAAQNNVIEKEMGTEFEQAWKESAKLNLPPAAGYTHDQVRLNYVLDTLLPKWSDPSWQQRFVAKTNWQTLALWGVRSVVGAGVPTPISIAQPFAPLTAEYNALLIKYKGDWQKAETEFLNAHPEGFLTLIGKSTNPSGYDYPATTQMVNWSLSNLPFVKKYSTAAVFYAPPSATNTATNPYSDFAESAFNYLQLRKKDSPAEYLNALIIAAANNYKYQVLYPVYDKAGQTDTAYQWLDKEWTAFQNNQAPVTLGVGNNGEMNRQNAMHQMVEIAKEPAYKDDPLAQILAGLATDGLRIKGMEASPAKGGSGYQQTVDWWTKQVYPAAIDPKNIQEFFHVSAAEAQTISKQVIYAWNSVFAPLAVDYSAPTRNPSG